MQDPVGYKIVNGQAELTSVWALLSSDWALYAFGHTILAGLTAGAAVVFGVCCWHFARGRNVELFRPAAKVALIVLVPVSCVNLWFGSHFGILVTSLQPMKISASEAQWDTCSAVRVLAVPDRRLHPERPDAELLDRDPRPALVPRHRLVQRQGAGPERAEPAVQQAKYGPGNYLPPVETIYWSMRGMAYAGSFVALVALVGAFLYWKRRLERLTLVPLGRRRDDASSRSSPASSAGC